jgi:adenylate cyclase
MQRRLTAILSADVVGYSALMERDEAGTLQSLKANRAHLFEPCVARHGGRIVKLMGDGALVEFGSVVAAVDCAHEIQQAIDAGSPIRYRIGINLGEVIVEGDDLYGDGVNVAARLQSLAEPGGVAISGSVRDQVAGKIAAELEDLGEHSVKNIARPIRVFALRTRADRTTRVPASPAAGVSICVLPFANMSGDPEQE